MTRTHDFLVVGGGIAGLSYALKAARVGRVGLLAKRALDESNTRWAQGGIAAVWDPRDSFEAHIRDTRVAGADLNRSEAVEVCVREGPDRIRELIALGVRFTPADDGDGFHLTREGGHSERRVLHFDDSTGAEVQRALVAAVRAEPRIEVFERHLAVDLITERKVARFRAKRALGIRGGEAQALLGPGGPEAWPAARQDRCLGAYALDVRDERVVAFQAGVTMLATGGAGKVYLYTTNPDIASGDGMAMAFRAGATLGNMEFVQFHPTCLYHPEAGNFLISEAVRGEGGVLRLPGSGEAFMARHDPRRDLAPRDVVARAIDHEMKTRGLECVHLDIAHVPADVVVRRFPTIHARCLELGIDITREPIPVVPAAHYFCGGVATDLSGRTDILSLYAAGEVACTGLHGANRLASNSLLEAAVFADRAAREAEAALGAARSKAPVEIPPWDEGDSVPSDEGVVVLHNWDEIRRLMWNYVGIVRTDRRLARARRRVEMLKEEIEEYYWNFRITSDLVELRNLATVADLVIRCAQARRESRGLHLNLDCPGADDARWLRDTTLRRAW